jgi:putative tryptophan/tyrosine transport system substrate-binding protein
MQRREFITLLSGAAAAWPLVARAQQGERMRRVGILMPFSPSDQEIQNRVQAFKAELKNRGWTAGANVQFDERWTTDNMDLIRAAAANLLELKPDAVVAIGGRVIPILMKMTSSIPIIVPGGISPVERGWVKSLARPGGNVTGFALFELSIISKMLETLKEIAPNISHVAMIYNPDNPAAALSDRPFEDAARSLAIEPTIARVHGLADIERVITTVAERPNGGVLLVPDVTVSVHLEQIAAIVAQHRLPSIHSERVFAKIGGLVYYGTDRVDLYRRAASYVDRVLRGEKPGDLPYQQPTKFELVVNLKTAKAIGVTVPPSLLVRADEVIE